MSTDFSYGGKQILISGPIKPNGKDMPSDARTRVESYADIASIPNPHVGLKITVKVDETNNNKMTDYIVKSLKANSMGVANSLIDEVVRYADYLGASSNNVPDYSTSDANKVLVVNSTGTSLAWIDAPSSGTGLTSEQLSQLQAAYTHSQSVHVQVDDIPTKLSELQNDSSYTTSTDVQSIVNNAISSSGNVNIRSINTGEIFVLSGSVPEAKFGEIVVSSSSLSVNENANTTFTVKLDKAPTNNQVVNIAVNNSYCTINPSSLTFTPSNYSTTQTVTVTAAQDSSSYDNKTSVITLSSDNVSSKTINVNIINIDERTTYTVTNNLTNVTSNNLSSSVTKDSSYTATLTAEVGYKLDTVTVTMGGTDITSSAYSNKVININQVTGNIVITATAIENVVASNLLVSYNFIPENAIYDNSDGNNNVIVRNEAGETHDWKFISSNTTSGYNPTNSVITSEGLCLKENKKTQSVQISDTNIFNGNAISLEILFYVDDNTVEDGNLWTTNSNNIFAASNSNGMGTKSPAIAVSKSDKKIIKTSVPYNSNYDATITLNTWNVLTITNPYETSNPAKIFINGQLVNTCQYGSYSDSTSEGYILGTKYAIVRRFKIYNEVLSEDTVLSNAQACLSEVNN